MRLPLMTAALGGGTLIGLIALSTTNVRADDMPQETLVARVAALEARVAQLEKQLGIETAAADDKGANRPGSDVPPRVRDAMSKLHPAGQIVETGRDEGDGYWWFEVRSGGKLFDVEIADTGEVRKNRPTRD